MRDKMGINQNVYMHAIYILAEGSDRANEIIYTDRSVSNGECILYRIYMQYIRIIMQLI